MAENVLYADLNLAESTRPRILNVPDIQDCTYAEVKVKSQDTNDATNCKSPGKGHRSRTRVAVLVAVLVVITLALAIVVCWTLLYGPSAGSQQDSTTTIPEGALDGPSAGSQQDSTTTIPEGALDGPSAGNQQESTTTIPEKALDGPSAGSQQDSTTTIPEGALGCPPKWEKHGRKCYFFSPVLKSMDWNTSRTECAAMSSDLVIIESKEELSYLHSRSRYQYYLLGLRYSEEEHKWKWINNVEHDPAMFNIIGRFRDYLCTVIGDRKVQTAPCGGSITTQNMCEKAATVSAMLQKDS